MKVAPAAVPDRDARKIAAELLRPMNQGLEMIGSATAFGTYVAGTYGSPVLPLLATTTRNNYECYLDKYLLPMFTDNALHDIDTMTLQKYFSGMKASHATASKIKDVLQALLGAPCGLGCL